MAIKEGKWKCGFCGAINLGRDMQCRECRGVRGDDVEFFLDDDADDITDSTLLNTATAGADWSCDYCQTDNRADAQKCRQCGAPRSDGGIDRKAKVIPNEEKVVTEKKEIKHPSRQTKKALILTAIGVGLLVILLLYLFVFRTREEPLTLESGSWERSIGLEENVLVTKENWQESVPEGARIISSREKQKGTEKIQTGTKRVKVGKKDLGNGFFEDVYKDQPVYEEKPVYDTWVTYRIMEWQEYNRVTAKGTLNDPPAWPAYTLKAGAREGSRREEATLILSGGEQEKKYKYNLKPEELQHYEVGRSYTARINALGAVLSLENP